MPMVSVRQFAEEIMGVTAPIYVKKLLHYKGDQVSIKESMERIRSLQGAADLHAHPAGHLAFGYPEDGSEFGGIIWGRPGTSTTNVTNDLPECKATHCVNPDIDPIFNLNRALVLILAGGDRPCSGGQRGYPDYSAYPAARNPLHQQMHLSFIKRAWRGGLRLMVASVTDNALLSALMNQRTGDHEPQPNAGFDLARAKRQIEWIKGRFAIERAWMQIATTPDEAEDIIRSGRLAVVLAVEMDQLNLGEILELKEAGVRLVTPIHLVDNIWGGAAIYDSTFSALNWYLNGKFYEPKFIDGVEFKLDKRPLSFRWYAELLSLLAAVPAISYACPPLGAFLATALAPIAISGGLFAPSVPLNDQHNLDDSDPRGHGNSKGLKDSIGLVELMKAGLMIDLSHMSDRCTNAVLDKAEELGYPVCSTHTGVQPAGGKRTAERDLSLEQAQRITRLGGVIGLGTGYKQGGDKFGAWMGEYSGVLDARANAWDTGDGWYDEKFLSYGGVGIGTDMNGLAAEMDEGRSVTYPLASLIEDSGPASILQMMLGTKGFLFERDGLAHYGMLAELFGALRAHRPELARSLRCSAFHTVRMWQRCTEAARRLRP